MRVVLILSLLAFNVTASEPIGTTEPANELLFGMSTALSGHASQLGANMRLGVQAAFERRNRKGGWQGKTLRLKALDDRYEPHLTIQNMRTLVNIPQMLAIIGNVGTPTAIAALPIIEEKKILFFAPFTGAGVLRKQPPSRYVVNYRASYAEEVSAIVDALVQGGLALSDIAFFTQRDSYGDAGFYGGLEAMRRHGSVIESDLLHVRYERNTLAVENALADIIFHKRPPKAVIVIGAYAPVAKFIKLARKSGLNSLFLNVSFVGSTSLTQLLGGDIEGVIVTQVVPHPTLSELSIVKEYRSDLAALNTSDKPSFGSLEGYVAGRILLRALDKMTENPDRETLIDALESLGQFDIGLEQPLLLDTNNHQASYQVWPTVLTAEGFMPFQWQNIAQLIKRAQNP